MQLSLHSDTDVGAYARIIHEWSDNTVTSMEVGCDDPSHPDLLDELTARVVRLWQETCADPAAAEGDE